MLALAQSLEAESDRWFLWAPVFFGLGIGAYFALAEEPPVYAIIAIVCIAGCLCMVVRSRPVVWAVSVASLCAVLGLADASLRTHLVAKPALTDDRAAAVTGWVEKTEERLPSGHRLTLRVLSIEPERGGPQPYRVRLTSRFDEAPETGTPVSLRAVLRPVPEPVIPGGFDFARKAYFDGLGAVGFTLTPATRIRNHEPAPWDIRLRALIDRVRHGIEKRVLEALPGERGAITIALVTGERGRIPEETLQALRDSGLAHLLAISGMHMALMAGALYWLVRALAAAIPGLSLRYPIKKWAAVAALMGGAFYLALSGAAVATQRAFLMMAIVFLAVLLDRPALTLRNVAIAAMAILVFFPESLFNVSFQMSFAAVTALIAVYERVERHGSVAANSSMPAWLLRKGVWYMCGIALTTLVASIAIAPFAAYHFNRLAQFSLLANLATMPFFGLLVMPAALAALVAMPFGLEVLPLHVMAWGIERIVAIAKEVSSWDGATFEIAQMPATSLVALVLGGLWLCLWQTRWRLAGLAIASVGLLTTTSLPKPDVLVERDGKVVAMRTAADELSAAGAERPNYSLEQWLRSDGDPRVPLEALKGRGFRCDEIACVATVKGKTLAFVHHPAAIAEECARADIVISRVPIRRRCPKARTSIDRIDLWREGAHALYFDGQSIRVETVAEMRGNRPWSRAVAPKRKRAPSGTAYAGDEDPREKERN